MRKENTADKNEMSTEGNTVIWLGSTQSAKEYINQKLLFESYLSNGVPDSVMKGMNSTFSDGHEERFGEYADFIQVEGNTAIVPVEGKLHAKENWITRMFGVMTYETLANIMAFLATDDDIKNVLLNIDSPGGEAKGLDVATDAIAAVQAVGKKVVSHTSGDMMSAAYWIGSTGSPVTASRHAEVGSIGVTATHVEYSEMHKDNGINITVLRKGKEKALATPFEKLTDKAREQIDRSMERSYTAFIDTVAENRGLSSEHVRRHIATGRVFSSQEGVDLNLIDEVASFNDTANRLVSEGRSSSSNENENWSEAAMSIKPIINASAGKTGEDAAAAIAAGIDPANLTPPGNIPGEQEASADDNHEEEAAEVTVIEPEADAGGTEEPEGEDTTPKVSSEGQDFSKMLANLNEQLVDAKVQSKEANAENAALKAGNIGLRKIAVESAQRLRVGLGMPGMTEDLEGMSDQALVTAHDQVREQFVERYNTGATSRVADNDSPLPPAAVTSIDQAVRKATTLR